MTGDTFFTCCFVYRRCKVNDEFFRTSQNDWLMSKLACGSDWADAFAVTCWWQWQRRNKTLFELILYFMC